MEFTAAILPLKDQSLPGAGQHETYGGKVKKSIKASALLVAGVFVLSGCGGSEGNAETAPKESSSPTPTKAVGDEQYSADDLEQALMAVQENKNLPGPLGNDAEVRPDMEGASDSLEGVTITPQQCDVLASTDISDVLENANIAIVMINKTDALTVVSHSDPAVLEKQVEDNSSLLGECAQYTMEIAGQVLTATSEGLDISTDAETSQAFETVLTGEGIPATSTIQVAAASGTTNVAVSISDAEDAQTAVAEAEELVDAVLAELKTK